jgi:hypothetical protein
VPSSILPRPSRRGWGLLASAALVLSAAACSSGTANATPPDASGLLTTISSSLASVKQVDAHLALTGTITPSPDAAASGAAATAAAPVKLDGTVVEVKSDTVAGSTDATLTLPAGIGGGGTSEVIVVGSDVYLKLGPIGTAMGLTDDGKYHHTTTTALGGLGGLPVASAEASVDPSQMAQALSAMNTFFAGLAQQPTIAAVSCGSASCWDLHVVLGPADLASLAAKGASALASEIPFAPLPTAGLGSLGSVALDVIARQADGRPSEIKVAVDGGAQGSASADLTFTFDTPLTISAPSADQVVEGFPGLLQP